MKFGYNFDKWIQESLFWCTKQIARRSEVYYTQEQSLVPGATVDVYKITGYYYIPFNNIVSEYFSTQTTYWVIRDRHLIRDAEFLRKLA